jgi:hypothetical protein
MEGVFMDNYVGVQSRMRDVMARVFGWMAIALGITATVSYAFALHPEMVVALERGFGIWALMLVQLGVAVVLAGFINKLSSGTAFMLYILYAVLTGVVFSSIFLIYTTASIGLTFGVCSAMFGFMALYGLFTNVDLTKMGSVMTMALFGLIIAMIINMFLHSAGFDLVISMIGVIVFAGLTAYDVQAIAQQSRFLIDQGQTSDKIALLGAFKLYLDFINLFLMLLRLLGKQRN